MKKAGRERRGKLLTVAPLLAGMALAALLGCTSRKTEDPASTKVETNNDPNVFVMEHPEQFPLMPVETRKVTDEVHVNCVVSPDVNRSIPVLSLGGGRVVDIRAKLGDYVEKGQVLLLIDSPDLTGAFSDYQKFKADEALARKQLERAQLLYEKGAIALADLENAEDNEQKARVDLQAAIDHVHVLGGDVNHPTPILPVRAPISGTIVEQNITGGTGVRSLDNSPNLFTIADLSQVWVLCDAYQDLLPRVRVGDIAAVNLNEFPDQKYAGTVTNISDVLDPTTRTAKVRIQLPNPQHLMRAGMFVTSTFRARNKVDRVVVPASAVVHLHDKDWVYVPEGGKKFRRVPIQPGPAENDRTVQVLSGLSAGQQVVTNALQFSSATEE